MIRGNYTLESYTKEGKPVFVVHISCPMLVGTYFFRFMKEAKDFIQRKKEVFSLEYDSQGIEKALYNAIVFPVLNDPNLRIGENGRTFSRKMFPNEKEV